ncbi:MULTISPECIES: DUF3107 domain-containing protein [Ornithinimicrobium]|uniref:DUF3107 domain-containing protein n=1 Tax=Ornithinimicrobium kibberense TaxID=282060 RepID=A0ABV5V0F5_9MICO|nr:MULTISPECIES: DUF3107 domain-containing protein [Ornithinimicrobium]OLT19674.1 ATP-binding protein [Ornithinimicrobium sp. CNJ-824]
MEVRIGIRNVAREVAFESAHTPEQVRGVVSDALSSGQQLIELEDDKGGTVLVPTDALAYVEIGAQDKGRVGFGR